MRRHAGADELADLAAGVLHGRKERKISAHLSGCAYCTDVSSQLANVSSLLASVPVAPMPANMSSRIESAIAAESGQRLASEPSTEAGRRDLPARSRRGGQGRRIPLLSGPASRLIAAAAALVIIGGGGYEIATHISATNGTSASSGSGASGAVRVPTNRLSYGPTVTYPQATGTKSLPTVATDTNFTGPTLGEQAAASLTAVRASEAAPNPAPKQNAHASPAQSGPNLGSNVPNQDQLTGCVDRIAAGRAVWLVELAYFDRRPATIIVIASAKSGAADVYAVGRGCSSAYTELLSHAHLAHI
jgi:hypothetical protein